MTMTTTPNIPSVMKAWQFDKYYPDMDEAMQSLKLRHDVPTPVDIHNDQVLVKVQYSSVNPIDWKIATGGFHHVVPIAKFPLTPGLDVGGTIVKVGPGAAASQFKVGDSIVADIGLVETCTDPAPAPGGAFGAFAEYCVVGADMCVKVPEDRLSTLSGMPLSALTAYQGLFTGSCRSFSGDMLGDVKEGSKVLILGGSGGVGTMAIQLAKAVKNCYVACTSSNVKLCKELGADQVINYKTEDWGEILAGQEFDLIYDGVGLMEDLTERAPKVLKKGGSFVSIINFDPKAKSTEDVRFALYFIKSTAKDLQGMVDTALRGDLKVVVDSEFDFKDVPAAMEKNRSSRAVGKVMIKM